MSFLDRILQVDHQLLIYLNNFGSEPYDTFWLAITKPLNWIPLFLIWIYLLVKRYNWRKGLFLFLFIAAMAGLSDVLVNIIKYTTARPRPCWQEGVMEYIRILKCTRSLSFVSGHATTSMAVTTFIYITLKDKFKWTLIFYLYPLLFAYSRIYMGKHYPLDIACGYILGTIEAVLYFKLAQYILNQWLIRKEKK